MGNSRRNRLAATTREILGCRSDDAEEYTIRTLGVSCTSNHAFLAVAEGGAVIERGAARIARARSTDEDQALWQTLDTFQAAMSEIAPDRIALLLPGTGSHAKQLHSTIAPRVELETLLRMAAAKLDLPLDRLAHATVRARLGVSKKGRFEDAVRDVVREVGPYWAAGRLGAGAAAMAALEG